LYALCVVERDGDQYVISSVSDPDIISFHCVRGVSIRIGIVAGEASGDMLGAALIAAVKHQLPDAVFLGIAGPRMIEQGCQALFPSEKLAVMGLVEVLGHFRELSAIRKQLISHFLAAPPDVFIGIDAPDFNLGLEGALKHGGIPTVHYVSPSVWAWRRYRLKKIARSTDLMLTLLPFEAAFYEEHHIPVRFVGHSLADAIPVEVDRTAARTRLGLPRDGEVVALLPGSRMTEVRMLGEVFIAAAKLLLERRPQLRFVAPLASEATQALFKEQLQAQGGDMPITVIAGQSQQALAAADAAMVASGTATLEALLLKCPMVMAYRLKPVTYWLAKHLLKVAYFSLPNLLAQRPLIPELIQDAVTAERLAAAVEGHLDDKQATAQLIAQFREMHLSLRRDAARQAAAAVIGMLKIHGDAALPEHG
jgi:lipid-A-disaccharide synthase